MTLFTEPLAHKIVSFGYDLVYPRNLYISGAATFAAWWGRQWSMTYTPYYLPTLCIRFTSVGVIGLIEETTGIKNVSHTWTDKFASAVLPLWYPDYVIPYFPYIHNAIAISAAVSVSLTLNLLAQAFFGIRSDKQKQNEPIATALGIPNSPQTIQNNTTTANPESRSQTTSVVGQSNTQYINDRDEGMFPGTSNPAQIPQSNITTVNPRAIPQTSPVVDQNIAQPANDQIERNASKEPFAEEKNQPSIVEPLQEPPSKSEIISSTTKSSKESKELLFDLEEYRKYAKEQACCWNPLKIMKITFC